jgi:hypothetical protein
MNNNYELLLLKLDEFIRKYYLNKLIKGTFLFLSLTAAYYLFASLFEYKLYFSSTIRKFILATFLIGSVFTLSTWILIPLFNYLKLGKTITHEQAAIIIGQHFQNVKDKLLNVLQLKNQSQNAYNRDLIEASIHQKIETIKIVPFKNAIQLSENKKYLKFLLPPIFAVLVILLIAPNVFKESNKRLANPNIVFAKKAPFEFILENKKLKAIQYEDFEVKLTINGKVLPNEVFIFDDGKSLKMEKNAPDKFSYRFTNLQKDIPFYFSAAEFNSDEFKIKVYKKPLIANFETQLNYPIYTNKKNEVLKNSGDLIVPTGTTIRWNFKTSATDVLKIFMNNEQFTAQQNGKDNYGFSKQITKDTRYTILVSNNEIDKVDSVSFTIVAIPDNFPAINVERIHRYTKQRFCCCF